MRAGLIPFLLTGGFSSIVASAGVPATLPAYLEQKIAIAEAAVRNEIPGGLGDALRRAKLQDFNPEFIAQASFGIGGVLQISVAPELDLVYAPAANPEKP